MARGETIGRRVLVVPDGYEVTRDGRVISHKRGKPRELAQALDNSSNGDGYPSVILWLGTSPKRRWRVAVHRLVAAVYLPPRPSLAHVICHCDGNKHNPHADNLRWDSESGNLYDRWAHKRQRDALARATAALAADSGAEWDDVI